MVFQLQIFIRGLTGYPLSCQKPHFNTLFGKGSSNSNVQLRTKKLFYVCITRAKENLIIYMPTNDFDILRKAKEFFGEENIIDISSID